MPWVEKTSDGRVFYFHTESGEAKLERPEEYVPNEVASEVLVDQALQSDWERKVSASGRVYYWNITEKKATWDLGKLLGGKSTGKTFDKQQQQPMVAKLEECNEKDKVTLTQLEREYQKARSTSPEWVLEQAPEERREEYEKAQQGISDIKASIGAYGALPTRVKPWKMSPTPPQQPYAMPRPFPLDGLGRTGGARREQSPHRLQHRRLLHPAEEAYRPPPTPPPVAMGTGIAATPTHVLLEELARRASGHELSKSPEHISHLNQVQSYTLDAQVQPASPSLAELGWSTVERDAWEQLAHIAP